MLKCFICLGLCLPFGEDDLVDYLEQYGKVEVKSGNVFLYLNSKTLKVSPGAKEWEFYIDEFKPYYLNNAIRLMEMRIT